jgi:REP element-mobilizing transposase RayT
MRKVCGDFDAESREFNGEDDRVNWHIMHGHFWSPSYFAASCGALR